MFKRSVATLLSMLVFMAGYAGAQCTPETAGQNGPGAPTFAEFDLDGDGVISSAEYYQARGARIAKQVQEGGQPKNAANMPAFETIDLDGDGSLAADEFLAHRGQRGAHPGQGRHRNKQ